MPRVRLLPVVALSLLAACADNPSAPDVLAAPDDPALLMRSIAIEVDVTSGTARLRSPAIQARLASGPRPNFALLGINEIGVILGPVTRTPLSTRDELFLDLSIVNKLLNVDMANPTFPAPPNTQGIFLVPFAATVNSGTGNIRANAGTWMLNNPTGAPERWNFFNDVGCPAGNNDCLPYATLPPLNAGTTSPTVRVSFFADRGVLTFTVYFIVAADLKERPLPSGTGAIAGVVTGDDAGALAGVTLDLDGNAATTTTDANGFYSFSPVPAGSHTVTVSGQPSYCSPLGLGVTVTAGALTTANTQLPCFGQLTGTVRAGTALLAGATVQATLGTTSVTATTGQSGTYAFASLAPGNWQVVVTAGQPSGCTTPPATSVAIHAGQTSNANITLNCAGTLRGTVTDGSSGQAIDGAAVSSGNLSVQTSGGGHYTLNNVPQGGGTLQISPPGNAPWCGAVNTPYTLTGGQTLTIDVALTCAPAPNITTTSLPQATAGTVYSVALASTPSGLAWTAVSIPSSTGLTLTPAGTLTGTPTEGGSTSIIVRAQDTFGRTDNATLTFTVVVNPDPFEPNNSQSAATFLGSMSNGASLTRSGNFHTTADVDFFQVRLLDTGGFCIGFESFTVDLALTVPVGSDYDLYVYDPVTHNLIASATAGGNITEQLSINRNGVCGADDAFELIVEVRRHSGPPTNATYGLGISYTEH